MTRVNDPGQSRSRYSHVLHLFHGGIETDGDLVDAISRDVGNGDRRNKGNGVALEGLVAQALEVGQLCPPDMTDTDVSVPGENRLGQFAVLTYAVDLRLGQVRTSLSSRAWRASVMAPRSSLATERVVAVVSMVVAETVQDRSAMRAGWGCDVDGRELPSVACEKFCAVLEPLRSYVAVGERHRTPSGGGVNRW